jgi:hypothetical protein
MGRIRFLALGASALLALCVLSSPLAQGEVSQKQGIRVTVDGALSPKRLPRKGSAPVAVSVKGEIQAQSASVLPQLQKLQVAINSAGHLDVKGIPHCRIGHINPSTDQEALAACKSSLIGEGSFSANVVLPEQSPFPSKGKLLAFNGTIGRQPAVFAHIYGTEPIPTSYVFAFRIAQKPKGTYGTILETSFPRATGDWGYVTGIELNLDKRFLTAGCPAPKGFDKVSFPLMKTSFSFKGGLKLDNTLTRSCEAKGR